MPPISATFDAGLLTITVGEESRAWIITPDENTNIEWSIIKAFPNALVIQREEMLAAALAAIAPPVGE